MEFKETLSVLLISTLFVVLGARLQTRQLASFDWRMGVFVGVLILVARPVSVLLCTMRSSLTWRERIFLAGMAPRGVVATAVASVFAIRLGEAEFPGADQVVPVTFAVVFGTVTVYGLFAGKLARFLGLSDPGRTGFLIVGANRVARAIGEALRAEGLQILLVDTNISNVQTARLSGLPVAHGSVVSGAISQRLELSSIGRLLALTASEELNALAAVHFGRIFGRADVFQVASEGGAVGRKERVSAELRGRVLFGPRATYRYLLERLEGGAVIKTTRLTAEFGFADFRKTYGEEALPMFVIDAGGRVDVVAAEGITPGAGTTVVSLVNPVTAVRAAPAVAGS
jgi:hypothetical protein